MSLTDQFEAVTRDNEDGEVLVAPRLPLSDGVPGAAAPAVRALLDEQMLDQMVAQVRADGGRLTGPGSFLSELCKAVLERGLQAELGQHLGYDKHDPAGKGSGNSRNGTTPKTMQTEIGPVALDVPRTARARSRRCWCPRVNAVSVACRMWPIRQRRSGATQAIGAPSCRGRAGAADNESGADPSCPINPLASSAGDRADPGPAGGSMRFEPAEVVPFREYPAAARPVLGARYVTVCAVFGERSAEYEHGYLLWSDEPFTASVVAREMTILGFEILDISPTRIAEQPWAASISSGPPQSELTYLGIFHGGDCALIRWIGLWSHRSGRVVHDKPDHGWHTVRAGQVLYEQRDLYELPRDNVVLLTARQATGLAIVAGRRVPTAAELAASIRTAEQVDATARQLWQRFHDHRAALFADDVRRLRAAGDRLADTPPPRQPVFRYDDRKRVVAAIPLLRVATGEMFPLLRFLVGDFHDRDPRCAGGGSYTVYANRLEVITTSGETIALRLQVMVRAGLLVHGPAFTPFCPAEADYTGDTELDLARSGQRWPEPLLNGVFPASPAMLEIWGEPSPSIPPATASAALRGLGITLNFPGGQAFAAAPGWSDTFHQWHRFVPATGSAGTPSPRERVSQIFVPDDINHMKTVQASMTETPTPA